MPHGPMVASMQSSQHDTGEVGRMTPVHEKVDPAALLIAVFAVGAGPLLQSGAWNYVNTVTAAVVLLVVVAFSWPTVRKGSRLPRSFWFPYATIYAFITAVAASWPAQWITTNTSYSCPDPNRVASQLAYNQASDCIKQAEINQTSAGTNGGMLAGIVALIIFFVILWLNDKRLERAGVT